MTHTLARWLAAFAALVGVIALSVTAWLVTDVRDFEWRPLLALMGWEGVLFSIWLLVGLGTATAVLTRRAIKGTPTRSRAIRLARNVTLAAWSISVLWLAEWTFLERPLTVRVQDRLIDETDVEAARASALAVFTNDGSIAALKQTYPAANEENIALMLARITIGRSAVFSDAAPGLVVHDNAERYGIQPITLLHWLYLESFYGEAPAGPMPFFASMNGEMFRDLVQAHLPWWFIESPIRIALVKTPTLARIFGTHIGHKLRYALQKANYDISASPYQANTFSDVLLVLREYPQEFPELSQDETPHRSPIASAFSRVAETGLVPPYESPEAHASYDQSYYAEHRRDLISFSRSALYRLATDFAFATKVQSLVARYYTDYFKAHLGADMWNGLSPRQQSTMLAILRDVYTPAIGNPSYNIYSLPEFNTTPAAFVVSSALSDARNLQNPDMTWLPKDRQKLWGSTALMLRVLSETWETLDGAPLPGVPPAATIEDATRVVARLQE